MKNDVIQPFVALFQGPEWKFLAAGLAGLTAALYPDPSHQALITTGLGLMVFDLITGVIASNAEGKGLKSWGIWRTVGKAVVYVGFPAAVFNGLKSLGMEGVAGMATTATGMLVVATELVSIVENIRRADLLPIPEWVEKLILDKAAELHEKPKDERGE